MKLSKLHELRAAIAAEQVRASELVACSETTGERVDRAARDLHCRTLDSERCESATEYEDIVA